MGGQLHPGHTYCSRTIMQTHNRAERLTCTSPSVHVLPREGTPTVTCSPLCRAPGSCALVYHVVLLPLFYSAQLQTQVNEAACQTPIPQDVNHEGRSGLSWAATRLTPSQRLAAVLYLAFNGNIKLSPIEMDGGGLSNTVMEVEFVAESVMPTAVAVTLIMVVNGGHPWIDTANGRPYRQRTDTRCINSRARAR